MPGSNLAPSRGQDKTEVAQARSHVRRLLRCGDVFNAQRVHSSTGEDPNVKSQH